MAIAAGFTGTAQRDRLQNGDVIFHHSRFTNHDAGGVIQHDATPDARRRMNIHGE